jgi:surface carbohydrate biosynthesis protein
MIKTISTVLAHLFSLSFWRKPNVSKHLIVMPAGANELFEKGIVPYKETFVLELSNYKWLNLFIVINGFIKRREFLFKNNYLFIVLSYIDVLRSQYVITWMDYQVNFYRLKTHEKKPIYVSIQTGRRSIEPGQLFDELQTNNYSNLSCDYVFCFGPEHAREYCKYIECNAIPSGSVRNNMVPINDVKIVSHEILFISQFRSLSKLYSKDKFITYNNIIVSHDTFYKTEETLLPLLANFCKDASIKLNILSPISSNEKEEKEYFDNLIQGYKYNFIKHKDGSNGYNAIDSFKFIVCVNSTLGYEALARNKRIVFFDCRGKYCGIPFDIFGWPMELNLKGSFWTNEITEYEFNRLMKFLINGSDKDWLENSEHIVENLMSFDDDNSLLRGVIK